MRAPRGARVPATRSSGHGPLGSSARPSHGSGSFPADQPGDASRFSAVAALVSSLLQPALCHLYVPRWSVGGAPFTPPFHGRNKLSTGLMGWGGGGRVVPAVRHCFPTPRSVRKHTLTRVCLCVRACVCTRRLRLLRFPRSSRVARGIFPQPTYISWQEVPHYLKLGGGVERDRRVGAAPESLAKPGGSGLGWA